MSINEFKNIIYDELKQERAKCDELVKFLSTNLPNADQDDPNTCLYLSKNEYWSQTIEDILEETGYDVLMLKNEICILFSEEVQEKIKETMIQEARLQRAFKRRK
jgi:hypothetical protein